VIYLSLPSVLLGQPSTRVMGCKSGISWFYGGERQRRIIRSGYQYQESYRYFLAEVLSVGRGAGAHMLSTEHQLWCAVERTNYMHNPFIDSTSRAVTRKQF
jgi:hypothetical protein